METNLLKNKLLLIVDPQIDFITGTLPVPGAVGAMDALAEYVAANSREYKGIIITCDRHPLSHCSFKENGGEWPAHCVESSVGAAIWSALMEKLPAISEKVTILYKGEVRGKDEYSIFQATNGAARIDKIIREDEISDIDICGIAGDVCVASTLRDALQLFPGIRLHILPDFIASLDSGMTVQELDLQLKN